MCIRTKKKDVEGGRARARGSIMAKYKKKLDDDIRCPLEYGLTIFGGKWKSRIICVLSAQEKLRYSELRKEMTQCQKCDHRG